MANAIRRPCSWPGCPALVFSGRCEKHRKHEQQEIDARRGSSSDRGYRIEWQKARDIYLNENPFCTKCGFPVLAEEVDHIKPHNGDMKLFWDQSNWQGLCTSCHSRKTAEEDGRWAPK